MRELFAELKLPPDHKPRLPMAQQVTALVSGPFQGNRNLSNVATSVTSAASSVAPVAAISIVRLPETTLETKAVTPLTGVTNKKQQISDTFEDDEFFIERAAIAQFDAGVPPEWVDGFTSLQVMSPPANISPERWQGILNDVGIFLDRWGAKASALGWTPIDLFGSILPPPQAAYGWAGLAPIIQGRQIVSLTTAKAVLEDQQGNYFTYERYPADQRQSDAGTSVR